MNSTTMIHDVKSVTIADAIFGSEQKKSRDISIILDDGSEIKIYCFIDGDS